MSWLDEGIANLNKAADVYVKVQGTRRANDLEHTGMDNNPVGGGGNRPGAAAGVPQWLFIVGGVALVGLLAWRMR